MEILVIILAVTVITLLVLRGPRLAKARVKATDAHTPSLTALAESLDGTLLGPGVASAWSLTLQHALRKPGLTLEFQRGPWRVRVTEAFRVRGPLLGGGQVLCEHWIEVARTGSSTRRARGVEPSSPAD